MAGELYHGRRRPYLWAMPHAVLSFFGPDRPGIVHEVSQFIFDRGGNIEDSRAVKLRGQFAGMMLVEARQEAMGRLTTELANFARQASLQADLRPADSAATTDKEYASGLPYRLTATGVDQPGLVNRLTHLLRDLGANVESLDTRLTAAPYTGAAVFEIELVLTAPRQALLAKLRKQLGELCDELNLDWELTAL